MPLFGPSRSTGKGPYRHQTAKWKGGESVAVGDLTYKSISDQYDHSAAIFPWNASLLQTQTDFKAQFRGVSDVRRIAAQLADGNGPQDGYILATGEFCFPCVALVAPLYVANNQYIAIAQGTGNTLNPALVIATTTVSIAIGKLTRDAATGDIQLVFEVLPSTGPAGEGPATIS